MTTDDLLRFVDYWNVIENQRTSLRRIKTWKRGFE